MKYHFIYQTWLYHKAFNGKTDQTDNIAVCQSSLSNNAY